MDIKYNIETLSNGIKLIYIPRKDNNISNISVFCKVGSIDENEITYGMSHYLEHMLFKGTNKRPTSKNISSELDQVGAYFNAYTDKELTCYIVKVNSDFIENSIDILGDILLNSKIDEKEINMEKEVVIEEINKGKDEPSRKVIENAYEIIFKSNPLSHSIGSEPENISNYKRQDVYDYYKRHYVSNNIIISIASNISLNKLIKYINNSDFINLKPNLNALHSPKPLFLQDKPRYYVEQKKLEQLHLAIGFPCESTYTEDRYTLDLIKIILAGNMSSRLFIDLRENNGLSYNVSMDVCYHEMCGCILIQTSLNKDSLFIKNQSTYKNKNELEIKFGEDDFSPGGLPIILENLKYLKNNLISKEELDKAKGYIKGSFILGLEDTLSISDYFGKQIVFEHSPIQNFGYLLEKYSEITPSKIIEISNKYFDFNKLNISIIGQYSENDVEEFINKYCFN
jgi:predicted Zn-dependent peptidase